MMIWPLTFLHEEACFTWTRNTKAKENQNKNIILVFWFWLSSIMRSIYSTFNHLDVIIIHQKESQNAPFTIHHLQLKLKIKLLTQNKRYNNQPTSKLSQEKKDPHHDLHLHHYYMAIKIFNLCYALYNLWWYTLRSQTGFLTAEFSIELYTHSISYSRGISTQKLWIHIVVQFLWFKYVFLLSL